MRVVVRGRDQLKPPLLDTDEASAIEFRDITSGDLSAIFARGMFGESTWMFVSHSDEDWPEALRLLGYAQEAPQAASHGPPNAWWVVVRGRDQLKPPLLDTGEASAIEFRDPANGELKAIFARGMYGKSDWQFASCSDKSWPEAMRLLGYSQEAPQETPDA